ncbi:MAG: AMP-binding protein [Bacteroidetes bacterium]|nr:AMP-binding protein [Bacteroidota bacterium]
MMQGTSFENIYELFIISCKNHAQREAIFINNTSYSYSEFLSIVSSIKAQIPKEITSSEFIGVFTDEHINSYATIWAILSLGLAYVPINKKYPIDRCVEIIEHSGLKILLYAEESEELSELKKRLKNKVVFIQTTTVTNGFLDYTYNEISPDNYIYLLYTSGSTGKAKGVPIQHKNINALAKAHLFNPKYNISEKDKFLQMFELTFDFSVLPTLFPFCVGAAVYVVAKKGILFMEVLKTLRDYKITKAYLVPSVINYLEPYLNEITLPEIEWTLFCGEALYENTALKWGASTPNGKSINTYGPTEATVFMTEYFIDPSTIESHNGIVSIGKAISDMSTLLIDGELYISGDQTSSNYWKDEALSRASFTSINNVPHYRSGDLCFENENGNLMYVGRADQQVKINGYRIELEEIEFHAKSFFKTKNLAALCFNEKSEIALVVENYDSTSESALFQYLQEKLPAHALPTKISNIDALPLSINGKTDRKALSKLLS